MEEKKKRIRELVSLLNQASEAYYNQQTELMSNFEWDSLFDELSELEAETGYVLESSPTGKTGAQIQGAGSRRERHEFPALSLAKSKDLAVLRKWAQDKPIWLSWKLDGVTLVATYDDGQLTRLMTRGNGTVGNNITDLAKHVRQLPLTIAEKGHFVVRGEAVISYSDFQNLNDLLEEGEEPYANPRNLVAGALSLDEDRAAEVSERRVSFFAFTLVYCEQELRSWGARMDYLDQLHFTTVDRELTDSAGLSGVVDRWTAFVREGKQDLPVDGLVITFDDTVYAATGSVTGHHATNAGMAYKWQDTVAETTLDHIEWSCAVSTISPVAVFDMVELEGTQVRRASLCNLSEMERLGIGADRKTTLKVIKSNMIIPKCVAADAHGTVFEIPARCPVCQAPTLIRTGEKTGTKTLHCTNPDCSAKQIRKFARFVSKAGMDIDGLSAKTLMKLINQGLIRDFSDIYHLDQHRETIVAMEGLGEKSYENLEKAITKSRLVQPVHFIYALCIPMIGVDAGKKILARLGTEGFLKGLEEGQDFSAIDGIGPEKAGSVTAWYREEKNRAVFERLLKEITLVQVAPRLQDEGSCQGKTFVITGDVQVFRNREHFKAYVERQGGRVTGSVSKKTDFLVNNDAGSSSAKNRKAGELGIPILTEQDFIDRFGIEE